MYPSAAALDHVAAFAAGLDLGPRPAPRASLHVTIAFLGEAPPAPALAAIETAASATGPFDLRLVGGGSFTGRGSTVLWAGVAAPALDGLAATVRRELDRYGVGYDDRPFRAHLTLGRLPEPVEPQLAALSAYSGPVSTIDSLALVSSLPGPDVAYEDLASWPLR
ncbi:RNA 2',3'-cyclic phosphodiesterase [Longispora fulva]|nr:RNA 2',3'-cyclic phosphodiesterase [Longispora fulva]